MNTLFNKVFAGCNMDLYINNPEYVKRLYALGKVSDTMRGLHKTDKAQVEESENRLKFKTTPEQDEILKMYESLVYVKNSLLYINRWHRAYLWMFRMQHTIDVEAGVVTILNYKYAFGKMFVLGETIRKFKC
jgi:hypothetical protein